MFYEVIIEMIAFIVFRIISSLKCPATERIIFLSPFTNLPMPHPLQAYPSLLTVPFHPATWFPVFVKVCGVLAMPQNLLLRRYNLTEESQFPVIKQSDLSLYSLSGFNIAQRASIVEACDNGLRAVKEFV